MSLRQVVCKSVVAVGLRLHLWYSEGGKLIVISVVFCLPLPQSIEIVVGTVDYVQGIKREES